VGASSCSGPSGCSTGQELLAASGAFDMHTSRRQHPDSRPGRSKTGHLARGAAQSAERNHDDQQEQDGSRRTQRQSPPAQQPGRAELPNAERAEVVRAPWVSVIEMLDRVLNPGRAYRTFRNLVWLAQAGAGSQGSW
jgi:hypothetical protein